MSFRVSLNNTLLKNNPSGLDDYNVSRTIDRENFTIDLDFVTDLVFHTEGYNILKDLREDNYCDIINCDIEVLCGSSYKNIIEGEIRLTNIEFNHKKCEARTKLKQRDFITRIKNNWKSPTSVTGGVDMYGNTLTKVVGKRIEFENVGRAILPAIYGDVTCYDLKECFQYYINYLTGSSLGLKSDWYDNLPVDEKITICSGVAISDKLATEGAPIADFETIFQDHAKAFNLLMGVVYEGVTPYIRIEQEDYWFSSDLAAVRNKLLEIHDRFNENMLYSTVKLGSKNAIKPNSLADGASMPYISFWSFVSDEFTISGACNLDSALDLEISNIVDSNEIERIMVDSQTVVDNKQRNQDVFYIQTNESTLKSVQPDDFISDNYYFNNIYRPNEVAKRWKFQGDLRRDSDFGVNTYRASHRAFTSVFLINGLSTLTYDDDSTPPNFDSNNNFNILTNRYTAPNDDYYLFRSQYLWRLLSLNPNAGNRYIRGQMVHYDSLGAIKQTYQGFQVFHGLPRYGINPAPLDVHRQFDYFDVFMESGDYVIFKLYAVVSDVGFDQIELVSSGSINGGLIYRESECVNTFTSGGILQEGDPDNYRVKEYEFKDQLSTEEMITVIKTPQKGVMFGGFGVKGKTGWGDISMNISKGETTFKLLSSAND